jgi:hypothetical protein
VPAALELALLCTARFAHGGHPCTLAQVNDPSAHTALPQPIDRVHEAGAAAATSVLARPPPAAHGGHAAMPDTSAQLAEARGAQQGAPAPPSALTPSLAQGQSYSAAQEVRLPLRPSWTRAAFCEADTWAHLLCMHFH